MTRTKKVLLALGALLIAGIGVLAVMASHDSPCPATPPLPPGTAMKAVVYRCYGSPQVMNLEQLAQAHPGG